MYKDETTRNTKSATTKKGISMFQIWHDKQIGEISLSLIVSHTMSL